MWTPLDNSQSVQDKRISHTRFQLLIQEFDKLNLTQSQYLLFIIIFRVITCALLTMNQIWPDQYYQGPEVAHKMTFGYGMETWEYFIDTPIRSRLYPSLLSVVYQILKLMKLDNTILMIFAPKIFQIIIAVLFDYYLVKLSKLYNKNSGYSILVINYCNVYLSEFMSRTFTNSMEATISTIAFYLWKKRNHNNYCDLYSRLLIIMGFIMRPTILFLWAPIWIYELFTMRSQLIDKIWFIGKNILTIISFFGFSMLITYYFQGRIIFIQYNFFKINILQGVAIDFGNDPFVKYFVVLGLTLNLAVFPLIRSIKLIVADKGWSNLKELLLFICIALFLFSSIAHKEFRFIMLIYPYIFIIVNKVSYNNTRFKIIYITLSMVLFIVYYMSYLLLTNTAMIMLNYLRTDPSVKSIVLINKTYSVPLFNVIHKNVRITWQDINSAHHCTLFSIKRTNLDQHPNIGQKLFNSSHNKTLNKCLVILLYNPNNGNKSLILVVLLLTPIMKKSINIQHIPFIHLIILRFIRRNFDCNIKCYSLILLKSLTIFLILYIVLICLLI